MSDIQSLLATPHTLSVGGKVYTCSHLDQGRKGRFAAWMKRQANQTAADYRRDTGDVEGWREMLADLKAEAEAGGFCFHSERAVRVLQTPAGALALSAILFDLDEEEMVRLTVAKPDEVKALVEVVLAESMAADRPNG